MVHDQKTTLPKKNCSLTALRSALFSLVTNKNFQNETKAMLSKQHFMPTTYKPFDPARRKESDGLALRNLIYQSFLLRAG